VLITFVGLMDLVMINQGKAFTGQYFELNGTQMTLKEKDSIIK